MSLVKHNKRKLTDFYQAVKQQGDRYQAAAIIGRAARNYIVRRAGAQRRRLNVSHNGQLNRAATSRDMVSRASRRKASRPVRRPRRRMVMRRKRVVRRRRRGKKAGTSRAVKWEQQAIQSYVYDYADAAVVPTPTAATQGKECIYFMPIGSGNQKALGGIDHMSDIARQIAFAQPLGFNGYYSVEQKFVVKDCYSTTQIINNSNASCFITSYLCKANRDNNVTVIQNALGDGFAQRGFGLSAGSTNSGVIDASLSPFDSHKFCSFFKIISTKKRELEEGATANFTIRRGQFTFNTDHYYVQNTSASAIDFSMRQFTRLKGEMFYLYKLEGIPANDSANKNLLSFTTPKVDFITKFHYNFANLSPQMPLMQKVVAGYGVPTNVEIRNEVSGATEIQNNS